MITIGINEGINSSVVVLKDGQIIFALQEERINRIKEYVGFPEKSLKFALEYLSIKSKDISYICLSNLISPTYNREEFLLAYEKYAQSPLQLFDKGLYKKSLKASINSFLSPVKNQFYNFYNRKKIRNNIIEKKICDCFNISEEKIKRTDHHLNHAASAYFGCRKNHNEPHLVLTLDGGGDGICSTVYIAEKGKLSLKAFTPVKHSLGNLYSRVTYYMGMTPHEHEYKLMGLAAYGKQEFSKNIATKFSTYLGLDPKNPLIFKSKVPEGTNKIVPRLTNDFWKTRFDNLASGLQMFTEDLLIDWIKSAIQITGINKVVVAGGVFMNVKANKRISEIPELDYFDVFPSCGDETLPFGAVWLNESRTNPEKIEKIKMESLYLGPDGSYDLKKAEKKYKHLLNFVQLEDPIMTTAKLLAEGKIVARCSGKMEFGARALGNRSILADPSDYRTISTINNMIKKRDFWMPFAPAITYEKSNEYLKIPNSIPTEKYSQWMMHSFETRVKRDLFTAGVHAQDQTARAQIVNKKTNPQFHKLIKTFGELTGKEVILNTSFNIHGYPIVMGAIDAVEVLLKSGLTHLVVEDMLITKKENG